MNVITYPVCEEKLIIPEQSHEKIYIVKTREE